MTIKYLDSKRLSGVDSDTKPTNVQDNSIFVETDTDYRYWFKPSTLNMDYSSGWTQVGTQITTGSDQVTFSSALCGTDRRVYKALGFTLDDTFTVEWEFSLTDSGSSQGQPFALTAGTSQLDNSTTSQDSIYFKSSSAGYQLACKDGTTNTQSSASTYTNGTTLYARLVRSGTSGTLSVYSDASRSTLVNSSTHTIPATVTGLNTLQHGVDAVQGGTRTLTGSISNVRVFNGSTGGTAWFPTFQDNFHSDRWTATGTDVAVDSTTNNRLDFNIPNSTNQTDAITYDLTSVSDSAWVLRFKIVMDNFSVNTTGHAKKLLIGLSSTSHSTAVDSAQDAIGILFGSWSSGTKIRTRDSNGATWMDGSGTDFAETFVDNETYYVEIKRTLTTAYTVSLYSDSTYSTLIEAESETMVATDTTGLQYLKVGIDTTTSAPSGTFTGYIDDVEFYNGVTSV